MVRIFVGGAIGIAFSLTRLLIAMVHSPTPVPSSRLMVINIAAVVGLVAMVHGLKYPRRYEG